MKQKRYKKSALLLTLLLSVAVVGASVWTFFGRIDGDFTVRQAITIDGNNYNQPIRFQQNVTAGDTITRGHTLTILANGTVPITTVVSGRPGVNVSFTINGQPITFPINLSTGSYKLGITYNFPINLKPRQYVVTIQFGVV